MYIFHVRFSDGYRFRSISDRIHDPMSCAIFLEVSLENKKKYLQNWFLSLFATLKESFFASFSMTCRFHWSIKVLTFAPATIQVEVNATKNRFV